METFRGVRKKKICFSFLLLLNWRVTSEVTCRPQGSLLRNYLLTHWLDTMERGGVKYGDPFSSEGFESPHRSVQWDGFCMTFQWLISSKNWTKAVKGFLSDGFCLQLGFWQFHVESNTFSMKIWISLPRPPERNENRLPAEISREELLFTHGTIQAETAVGWMCFSHFPASLLLNSPCLMAWSPSEPFLGSLWVRMEDDSDLFSNNHKHTRQALQVLHWLHCTGGSRSEDVWVWSQGRRSEVLFLWAHFWEPCLSVADYR